MVDRCARRRSRRRAGRVSFLLVRPVRLQLLVRSTEADKYSRKLSIYRTVVEPSSPGGAQPKPFEQLVATGVQLGDEVKPRREATLCVAAPAQRKHILAQCRRHVTADRCGVFMWACRDT